MQREHIVRGEPQQGARPWIVKHIANYTPDDWLITINPGLHFFVGDFRVPNGFILPEGKYLGDDGELHPMAEIILPLRGEAVLEFMVLPEHQIVGIAGADAMDIQ